MPITAKRAGAPALNPTVPQGLTMEAREISAAKRLGADALKRVRSAPDARQRKLWDELAKAWKARAADLERRRLLRAEAETSPRSLR
jgi:hypothetical protein